MEHDARDIEEPGSICIELAIKSARRIVDSSKVAVNRGKSRVA